MTNHTTAIEVAGLTKSYADNAVLRGIDLTVPAGTVYALLGPNGAGKTTMVRILSTLITADAGEARVAGFDVRREPDGVRRSIGVTGQFSAIDELLTGRENLRLMADLAHLPQGRGGGAGRGAAGPLRPDRRRRPARGDVLRRHEAPPRPRHDAGEPAAADLPRRADDRPRPAQPARPVADRPRAAGRRGDDLPHHAVPRGGRPARRHGRRCSTAAGWSRRGRRPSSRRRPAGRPSTTSSSPSPATRPPPRRTPSDDEQRRAGGDPMTTLTYAARDSTTMLRRNLGTCSATRR